MAIGTAIRHGSMRVLVIGGEAGSPEICRASLTEPGLEVTCVPTGESACEISRQQPFNCAIISTRLPGMNCIETYELLKQLNPGIIGILLTGSGDLKFVVQALNSGFSGVLEQPLVPERLVERLQQANALKISRDEDTRLSTLLPIYKLGTTFLAASSREEIFSELLDAIVSEIGVPAATIMLPDEQTHELKIVASRGIDEAMFKSARVKPGEMISGWVFEQGRPLILNRSSQDKTPFARLLSRSAISASISFPLISREKVIGVINISNTRAGVEYSSADMELLSVLTSFAVLALENVQFVQEKEKSIRLRTLFEQYVAPEVADLLLDRQEELMDLGGVQELTVLFADIRHFTLLVQQLELQQLRIFLNEFFDLFTRAVYESRGTLDKFMGDGALVIFGAPIAIKKPSRTAVATALRIVREFDELRLTWQQVFPVFGTIGLGIGISRGLMFIGNVGSRKRLDYTVIGTDVNIAQRLASETSGSDILITAAIREDIGNTFPIVKEEEKQLRGLDRPVSIFTLKSL